MAKVKQQRPFVERKIIGEFGEDVVISHFKEKGYKYRDVRHIKEFQQAEIDFFVTINGKEYSVEVKASEYGMHLYKSIMVKTYTRYLSEEEHKKRGDDSYLFRTKADFLFYVCCITKQILIIKTNTLRNYVNANLHSLSAGRYSDKEESEHLQKYNRLNETVYIPIKNLPQNGLKKILTNYKLDLTDYNLQPLVG